MGRRQGTSQSAAVDASSLPDRHGEGTTRGAFEKCFVVALFVGEDCLTAGTLEACEHGRNLAEVVAVLRLTQQNLGGTPQRRGESGTALGAIQPPTALMCGTG